MFFHPNLVSLPVWNMFNQISSKFAIMFLLAPFTLQVIHFFLISIFKVKNCVFHPKLVSVWNMLNQILSKLATIFLLVPFTLLIIQLFLISIFKVKNSVFLAQNMYLFPFGTSSTKFPLENCLVLKPMSEILSVGKLLSSEIGVSEFLSQLESYLVLKPVSDILSVGKLL